MAVEDSPDVSSYGSANASAMTVQLPRPAMFSIQPVKVLYHTSEVCLLLLVVLLTHPYSIRWMSEDIIRTILAVSRPAGRSGGAARSNGNFLTSVARRFIRSMRTIWCVWEENLRYVVSAIFVVNFLVTKQILSHMEFFLVRRCIPHFKKELMGVVLATCPPEVWLSLKYRYACRFLLQFPHSVYSNYYMLIVVFAESIDFPSSAMWASTLAERNLFLIPIGFLLIMPMFLKKRTV